MLLMYLILLGGESEEDKKKIAELYEKYKYDCLHTALKITRSQDIAEDALHDAFISVINHKEKILQLSNKEFRSMILVVVKNKCIDIMRKRKYISDIPLDDLADELDSGGTAVDMSVIQQEQFQMMINYLSQIDEVSRTVLQMKYVNSMSYRQIGEELGMSAKQVENYLTRAKTKVRRLLEKDFKGDE